MNSFKIKSEAAIDIRSYSKFITERDGQARADDFVDHLYDRFEVLAAYPTVGRDASRYGIGLRVWADRRYKVFIYYTLDESEITIERVISMRQQQDKAFL